MKLIKIILLLSLGVSARAQNDTVVQSKVTELQQLFLDIDYQSIDFRDTSLAVIRKIAQEKSETGLPNRSVYLSKRAEQLRRDLGLDLVGNYMRNANLDPTEDLEENITYSSRVQIGLQWDLLRQGYLENRVRARILEDRILREKLSNDIAIESQYFLRRFDLTVYAFNTLKLDLLEKRRKELRKEYQLIRDLVFLRKLKKEQLIKVEIRLSEVESLINVFKSYNDFLEVGDDAKSFESEDLPLIDLDYEAIFSLVSVQTDSLLTVADFESYYKWYHSVQLRPFVRYNYYDMIDQTNPDRAYFSGGVNVSVPLSFNTKLNNEVEQEKWRYENERFAQDRSQLQEEVLNTAYDFRYQMKQFVDRYQRRKLIAERLRIEKAKFRLSQLPPDPINGLDFYDQLMEADLNLIDALQGLYLKALKIQTKIPGTVIDDIIKSQSAGDLYAYVSERERSVYIWSKTFEEHEGDFLAEYALYNEFGELIVAVSDQDQSAEKKRFIEYASENGEVYFMLGDNRLFYHENIGQYLADVLKNYDGAEPTGIHLDIEPHTFENWDTERGSLLEQYVALVERVRGFCDKNDLKLSISVPKHYGASVMKQLFGLADKVYFMCYENVKTDFLVRRLQPYVDEYKNQVVIALRTEDFANRLEMENKTDELEDRLGIKAFAYHDLRRMIELDKQEE